MHIEVNQGVPGDPHFLDMDKKHIEWNSAIGTHWKTLRREYLDSRSKEGGERAVSRTLE